MSLKNIEKLSKKITSSIEIYCSEMIEIHQNNLISIYAYGDTLEQKNINKKSRLPLLFIFENITMDVLDNSIKTVKKGLKNNIVTPLFLTPNNIKTSTDVFPLEFLEIKNNNILLHGKDLAKDIEIETKNIRLQCEQEIKGKIIRLRQTYLEQGANNKVIESLILDSFGALIPVFKGLLGLKGINPALSKEATIETLCSTYQLKAEVFTAIINDSSRDSKINNQPACTFFANYVQELTKLAAAVDKMDK